MTIIRRVGIHSRATMWAQVVRRMLGLGLDGELLRSSASRFLERAGMPLLREVAVVRSRGLADTVVNPARVWFPLKENGVNKER